MGRILGCTRLAALAAPVLLLAGAAGAADGTESGKAELESLKQRLAEVEARLAAGPAAAEGGGESLADALKKGIPSKKGSLMKFYGFLRIDAIFDDSSPSNTQTIGFVRPEDPTVAGGADKDDEDLTIHPRLTRFGFDLDGGTVKDLRDAKLTGKLEIDFYNNGLAGQSESRAALRMRHAWLQLDWGKGQFLAGQTNDLIAPLWPIVNPDLVNWGAGNLGDRRAQFRYTRTVMENDESKATVAGMAGLTGAQDNQNLDADGIRDGEASAWPTLQARAAWSFLKKKAEVGVWAHYAREAVETPVAGEDDRFTSSAIGVDAHVPFGDGYAKAEFFRGHNLDDVRGGIFQGVDPVTGEEVHTQGGWVELGWKVRPTVTVAVGVSQDECDDDDINPAGGRERNRVAYAAVNFNYDPVEFGIHYMRWHTAFEGVRGGLDNRVQVFIAYHF
jgi:hypothetical protein